MKRPPPMAPAPLLLAACCTLAGCLERTIRVTSDPPGAIVWINDVEIGQTPAQARFKFYGVYDVRLELDGYEPVHEGREAKAPFYEYPGPDLIASAVPARIQTNIDWHYELKPSTRLEDPGGQDAIIQRGQSLRDRLGPTPQPTPPDTPPAQTPSQAPALDAPAPPAPPAPTAPPAPQAEPRPEPPVIEPAGSPN